MANIKVYEVGGSIRNELLNLPVKDRDFCITCDSFAQMREFFLAQGGVIWQEREEFYSIRGKLPGLGNADYTMARREGFYSDGRHPDKVEPCSIEEDLARRDIRFNAMAREVGTDRIIDPFDGQSDLKAGIVRCVGNPADRFKEDSLRAWRVLRFAVTFDFYIDPDTAQAILALKLRDFNSLSRERISDELTRMLMFNTRRSISLLISYPLMLELLDVKHIRLKSTLEP